MRWHWEKMGRVFVPDGKIPWMQTHAALPVVDTLGGSVFAMYFSSRDPQGRARIGRLDFDLSDGFRVLRVFPQPAVDLGPPGAYDESGVTSSCIVADGSVKWQYFSGWSLGKTVPFYFYIGAAISTDDGCAWRKLLRAPLLGRDECDPFLTASPCVMIENGLWRMWYVSCVAWVIERNEPKHYYHIKYAESTDGRHWSADRRVCIDFKSADEYAIGRPCVVKDHDLYRMWYCYRGDAYRIGYAESTDGISWTRKDENAGITVSDAGWDADMVAYPWVFRFGDDFYMLYNGNGYGKSGVGLAIASI